MFIICVLGLLLTKMLLRNGERNQNFCLIIPTTLNSWSMRLKGPPKKNHTRKRKFGKVKSISEYFLLKILSNYD